MNWFGRNRDWLIPLFLINIFITGFFIVTHSDVIQAFHNRIWSISAASARGDFIKPDTDGVIEQVLNYTRFGSEQGDGKYFYQRVGACHYQLKALPKEKQTRYKVFGQVLSLKDTNQLRDMKNLGSEVLVYDHDLDINFNQMDGRLITYDTAPAISGPGIFDIIVKYNDQPLIRSQTEINIDRLARGWHMIFDEYCPGIHKAF